MTLLEPENTPTLALLVIKAKKVLFLLQPVCFGISVTVNRPNWSTKPWDRLCEVTGGTISMQLPWKEGRKKLRFWSGSLASRMRPLKPRVRGPDWQPLLTRNMQDIFHFASGHSWIYDSDLTPQSAWAPLLYQAKFPSAKAKRPQKVPEVWIRSWMNT